MKFFYFLFFIFLVLPFSVQAATADLSIQQSGITFSETELITGDTVRIYAAVENVGDIDVSGYVMFYQGDLLIGNSQVISLRSGGLPEEVFVDFVVPTGSFNIRAEIKGTDPEDGNSDNNSAVTKLLTPILDDDRDGIENNDDNCPSVKNADQADADVDGLGDVCDDDDDNDGITDEVEREIGTDPKKTDSDGDGLVDASDPHPTVPESQVVKETPPPAPPVIISPPISPVPESESPAVVSAPDEPETNLVEVDSSSDAIIEPTIAPKSVVFSPRSTFTLQQLNWNTYHFVAQLPPGSTSGVTWDFGDGVTSAKTETDHKFTRAGDYSVQMRFGNSDGSSTADTIVIHVPFFSLENRLVQFLLGLLLFVLLIALQIFFRVGRKPKNKVVQSNSNKACKISVRREDD
ncbi:MAG: PKD domain-containing protein [Candidatus Uhrbacteria bacterium]